LKLAGEIIVAVFAQLLDGFGSRMSGH
jgi:hypothetical protein